MLQIDELITAPTQRGEREQRSTERVTERDRERDRDRDRETETVVRRE
jgi:hypothetical protein